MARYALVVGISEYKDNSLDRLSKPEKDAKAIAQVLEDHGDWMVTRLIDSEVTGKQFAEELEKLLTKQAVNQEALIYFTGHGITGDTPKYDRLEQRKNKGFLTTYDCSVTGTENNWTITDGISFQSIIDLISPQSFHSLTMIIDACRSGSLIEEIRQDFTIFKNKKNYLMIASCQTYELSWAMSSAEHSVFTEALLEALSREQADRGSGNITAIKIYDFISNKLKLKKEAQEPIFLSGGGYLSLVSYPMISQDKYNKGKEVSQNINNLVNYKKIHELLHSIDNELNSFSPCITGEKITYIFDEGKKQNLEKIIYTIDEIERFVKNNNLLIKHRGWFRDLIQNSEEISESISNNQLEILNENAIISSTIDTLKTCLTHINKKLTIEVQLTEILDIVNNIRCQQYSDDYLYDLENNINSLIDLHDKWQDIDALINQVKTYLYAEIFDLRQIKHFYYDLQKKIRPQLEVKNIYLEQDQYLKRRQNILINYNTFAKIEERLSVVE